MFVWGSNDWVEIWKISVTVMSMLKGSMSVMGLINAEC